MAADDADDELVTGEAVTLSLRPTNFVLRAAGCAIDYIVYFAAFVLLTMLAAFVFGGVLDDALFQAMSIALLVGGIGVANTMVITVLERRREIGLRRALGATKRHIRLQFLFEAMLLSAYGGFAGAILGWVITAIAAAANGWKLAIPPAVLFAAVGVTIAVGAIAGLLPAIRAAKTSPTAALNA